jgi:flagellar biosynthesis/type III secretory pathway protein FliH
MSEATAEVQKAVAEVKTEAEKLAEAVKAGVEKGLVELELADKFVVRDIENTFLKTQAEFNRLQQNLQAIQKQFPELVEKFSKKYLLDPAEWAFDAARLAFVKKPAAPTQK